MRHNKSYTRAAPHATRTTLRKELHMSRYIAKRGVTNEAPMQVRIYKPSKTAMQSGQAKTKAWVLEPVSPSRKDAESLMGWVSSADTLSEIRLCFDTMDEAVAFAAAKGWQAVVQPAHTRAMIAKSYSDNFAFKKP
jgi:hypothetical protein